MEYKVVFTGEVRDEVGRERVIDGLMQQFRFSRERSEQLLSTPNALLQRGLTEKRALALVRALLQIGVVAEMRPMEGVRADSADPANAPTPAPAPARDEGAPAILPFEFLGSTSAYFRIWIVNILLTVLTLGIYSAWAKVRTNRYFYAHTRVAGSHFEYLANPIAILKGRVLAVLILLAYVFVVQLYPLAEPALLLVLFLVAPLIIVRAFAFRNRNTAYRNIRFGFDGSYGQAFVVFVLWPVAGVLSLGLLIPHAVHMQKRFIVQNSRYGLSHFDFEASSGRFYRAFLVFSLILLVAVVLGSLSALPMAQEMQSYLATMDSNADPDQMPEIPPELLGAMISYSAAFMAILLAGYLLALGYFHAMIGNLVYASSALVDNGFQATLSGPRLAFIYFTNALAVLLSLGLARPWAAIRLARYRAACLSMITASGLDEFVAGERDRSSAAGEEFGEVFDMDVGL